MEQEGGGLHSFENSERFWNELDEILNSPHTSMHELDEALGSYLRLISECEGEIIAGHLTSEYNWTKYCYKLLESDAYRNHETRCRRHIIESLGMETANPRIYLLSSILLYDGRRNEEAFEAMQAAGIFPRLLSLIVERKEDEGLRRRLLELLYEMSRIQKIRYEDLRCIDDHFISHMFALVEEDADVNDPYHYVVIRVLLVLNEQYMVFQVSHREEQEVLTNKVIKTLCLNGDVYKTFGENIILLLNREIETRSQILILKLLYLLFTTPATYEYFYLNDLYVLVDVIIRNLLDLPDDAISLRQTYLRVLYPLMAYSQLRKPPHYKRNELVKLFRILANVQSYHFQAPDETTLRLVARCSSVGWLEFSEDEADPEAVDQVDSEEEPSSGIDVADSKSQQNETLSCRNLSEESKRQVKPPLHKALGMSLSVAQNSSVEVAALTAKPGVKSPSRSRPSSSAEQQSGFCLQMGDANISTELRRLPPVPANHAHNNTKHGEGVPNSRQEQHRHNHLPPPPPLPRGVRRASTFSSASSSKSVSPPPHPPPPPPPRGTRRRLQQQQKEQHDTATPPPFPHSPPPPPPVRRKAHSVAPTEVITGEA